MCSESSLVFWCGYPQSKSEWRESGGKDAGRTQKCQAGVCRWRVAKAPAGNWSSHFCLHRLGLEMLEMSLFLAQSCSLAD